MHGQHAPLLDSSYSLTDSELDAITATMPLTARYSVQDGAFDGWALLFRDHYLEHSVGFVLAAGTLRLAARVDLRYGQGRSDPAP